MTFGTIARFYQNINYSIAKKIAKSYTLDHKLLTSYTLVLNELRNLAAHHQIIWNRTFVYKAKTPKNQSKENNRKLSFRLDIMELLLNKIAPENNFRFNFNQLVTQYNISRYRKYMGFDNH